MTLAIPLILAFLVIAALVIFIARQPDEFQIKRAVAVSAPASVPFAQVNDFHRWLGWSPWEGIDPNLKRTYEGPTEGVGTRYAWEGGSQVGAGIMTITESRAPGLIRLDLEFLRPFKARNVAEFTFDPQGDHTLVAWRMTGRETFVTKAFGLVFNRDKLVGGMFQKGLDKMKTVCESVT